jgi:uncharacterized membrane protein
MSWLRHLPATELTRSWMITGLCLATAALGFSIAAFSMALVAYMRYH